MAIAERHTTIGARHGEHDLSTVDGRIGFVPIGGISEQPVPFIVSAKLTPEYAAIARSRRLRNFDIFDFVLNGTL